MKKRAQRYQRGMFLGEGIQFLREALSSSHEIHAVIATSRALREADELLDEAESKGVQIIRVSEEIMSLLSDTVTPQGVITVSPLVHRKFPPDEPLRGPLAFLDQLRDPGNMGTLIRAADAAGLEGVLISRKSADPYNPKAVRASAGSLLNLPLYLGLDAREALETLKSWGFLIVAAVPDASCSYWDFSWRDKSVIMLGNEAWGIPDEDRDLADAEVSVPIFGGAESLNVATAAALMFYEVRRRFPIEKKRGAGD